MNKMPDEPGRDNDRTRSMLAVVICVLVYLGYSQYLNHKYPDYMKRPAPTEAANVSQVSQVESQAQTESGVPQSQAAKPAESASVPAKPDIKLAASSDLTFESDVATVTVDQNQSAIQSVLLKKYMDRIGADGKPINILDSAMVVQGIVGGSSGQPAVTGVFSAKRDGEVLTLSRQDGPWLIEQTFAPGKSEFDFDATIRFTNTSGQPQTLRGNALVTQTINTKVATASSLLPGSPTEKPRIVANLKDSDQFVYADSFCEERGAKELSVNNSDVRFFGFDRHYFLAAFIPAKTKTSLSTWMMERAPGTPADLCSVAMMVTEDFGVVNAGQSAEIVLNGFLGPKVAELLKRKSVYLADTLDMGWLDVLAQPLLLAIKGFEGVLKNYGLAIVLLTILLKILFYPLTKKAAESAHRMKKFNPEMQRIRERHKDDPRTQQQEVMRFMAAHKLNPMQGCLPILPQIPVFLAFYRVLSSAIELRHAPFFAWIQDLSVADPYYVTPLLLGAGMFIQQKLTPMTGMDKTQEKVMLAMPIIFTVMMLTLPAGMVLYMLTNTVMSIAQQQWLNRKLTEAAAG
ncbi:MAG: hypothetical protein RIQ81_2454 [Pseudomonadota bacterium]|jgi:YidC/Oxa1 family membrane protein insertase